MAELLPLPKLRFFDANGAPLVGGKLYTYEAGTTIPLATYTDQTGETPNENPIVLDANGECDAWIQGGVYKLALHDAQDVQQWVVDNVSRPGTGPRGSSFLSGAGEPLEEVGVDGDSYLDLVTFDLYKKAASEWTVSGSFPVPADTDDLPEGILNLYFREDRVSTVLNDLIPDTDALPEGSTNQYHTDLRVDSRIAAASIGALVDVDTQTDPPTTGKVLMWDGIKWAAGAPAGGGGGAGLEWYFGNSNTPIESVLPNGMRIFEFSQSPDEQEMFLQIPVPSTYPGGIQILLQSGKLFASATSGNVLLRATTYLFKAAVDGTSTPSGYDSTNSQVAVAAVSNQIVSIGDVDLSTSDGKIASVSIAAGDTLVVKLTRKTSLETSGLDDVARVLRASFQPKFTA